MNAAATRRLGACVRKTLAEAEPERPAEPRSRMQRMAAIVAAPGASTSAPTLSTARTVQMSAVEHEDATSSCSWRAHGPEENRTMQLGAVSTPAADDSGLPVPLLIAMAIGLLVIIASLIVGISQLL